jgi:hypothetical protein
MLICGSHLAAAVTRPRRPGCMPAQAGPPQPTATPRR